MVNLIFDIETTDLMGNLMERIICICVHNLANKETKSFSGEDEGKILEDFFNYIKSCDKGLSEPPRLIGFNSDSFDLPFIIRRAIVHKKKVPYFLNWDLRKIANGFKYSYNRNEHGKLRDWAVVLGVSINTSPGSEMFKYYYEKRFDLVEKHCLEDVEVTKKLFEHLQACGLLNNGWKN